MYYIALVAFGKTWHIFLRRRKSIATSRDPKFINGRKFTDADGSIASLRQRDGDKRTS
jgi:hypothetical protein